MARSIGPNGAGQSSERTSEPLAREDYLDDVAADLVRDRLSELA